MRRPILRRDSLRAIKFSTLRIEIPSVTADDGAVQDCSDPSFTRLEGVSMDVTVAISTERDQIFIYVVTQPAS